jgi:hypothetical protein
LYLRVSRLGKFAAALLLLGLTGCRFGSLIDRMAPDAIRESKGYFEQLRQRQVDQILQSFDPRADKDSLRGELGKVVALVPQEEPIGVDTLGVSAGCKGSGVCTKRVTLEYKYPDHWLLFQVTTSNASGSNAITYLTVTPESMQFESMSQFTLRRKGPLHYFVLFMTLLSAGIALYALVLCVRTPMLKRKWLWTIVIILGIGKFGIEWTSGVFWYRISYLSILPFGWGFELDGPFMYASIPAGAILFLLLRSRLRRTNSAALPINPVVSTTVADQFDGTLGQ